MKNLICQKLAEIEEKENVKILYAVESGSRSWGVASPDSDYDVRFIYIRKPHDYLDLREKRDVIEWQLDEVLDINGWDLKKVLQHFHKGNASIFEWCNSPVVYKTTDEWEKISKTGAKYFSQKVALYHYYGTAKSTYNNFLTGDKVKYKKYIYALRPILACRYIEENHSAPPVLFSELAEKQLPHNIRDAVNKMLSIKAESNEGELMPQIPLIIEFIKAELERLSLVAKEKNDDRAEDWEELNRLFLRAIGM